MVRLAEDGEAEAVVGGEVVVEREVEDVVLAGGGDPGAS
jgi:hypothetical protein